MFPRPGPSLKVSPPSGRVARGGRTRHDRTMTPAALVLVLVAAVLHALWNLLAKRAGGGAVLVWLYGTVSAVLLTPCAVLILVRRPGLGPVGLSYTLASAVIHVVYFLVLQRGYQLGDLSVVYPV